MTYATQQDLEDRFGSQEIVELTNRAGGATIDTDVVSEALDDADATINGYLSTRYSLPLSPVPSNLVRFAADIARYFLHEDRATEGVKARYDAAIAWLKDVATGKAGLGTDASGSAPTPADTVQFPESQKVFAREELADDDC